jgi:hypothetical protein
MAANGGMPVSGRALAAVGKAGVVVSEGHLWKHVPLTAASKVPLLGDVIPVPLPLLRSVISVGDVAMLVGLAVAVTAVMGRERVRSLPLRAALVNPPGA